MESTSLLKAIARRWWIIAALMIVGAAFGATPEPAQVEERASTFRATHTMLQNDNQAVGAATGIAPAQVPLLATTGEVPARVADSLEFDGNPATLASQVSVDFDFSTGALFFRTTQTDRAWAETIVDAFADTTNNYLAERQDAVYQERLAASLERLTALQESLDEVTRQLAVRPDDPALLAQRDAFSRQYSIAFEQNQLLSQTPPLLGFTTIERAQAVEIVDRGLAAPSSRRIRGVMGIVAGAALGLAVAVLLARLDRRIRTRDQAESVLGMRARVTIPKVRDPRRDKLVVTSDRHDALSDSYRTLRNVVGFVQNTLEPVDRARVTLIASPGPGDGKTSMAINLAAAFVETGRRTIVVNTDFRRPRLARAVDDIGGFSHPFVLEDLDVLGAKSLLTRTETPGLLMLDLSSINGQPGELVRATAALMPELAAMCDEIVIDTSPVGATAEVLDMVPFADVIVVSVRLGHTVISAAKRTVAVLRDVSTVPILLGINSVKQDKTQYYEYNDRRGGGPDDGGRRSLLRGGRRAREVEQVG